jgi:RNA polymerase sigma-70 factor (ECF subfamily)
MTTSERALPTISPNDDSLTGASDEDLIGQTLAGDQTAFEQLVERYSRRVFAVARHFFRSPEAVEDIAQETFARAFFSLAGYRRGASFEHWLVKITINNCYNELRRRKLRGDWLQAAPTQDEGAWLENKLARASFELHSRESERERAAEVAEKLMARLPVDDRLLLTLLYGEGCSVPEIAQLMGWTQAKVKTKAFRARHKMRWAFTALELAERRKAPTRGGGRHDLSPKFNRPRIDSACS